jgi:hypothetical protein
MSMPDRSIRSLFILKSKAAAEHELLFNKPVTASPTIMPKKIFLKKKKIIGSPFPFLFPFLLGVLI